MPITDPRPHTTARRHFGWHDRAACQDMDTGLFFAAEGERSAERRVRERAAKAVCAGCPVWEDCLDQALSTPEREGIWAGTDPDERVSLRRRRNRKKTQAAA
jgi:WhiB family redox-sensing transcriptional regulator